MGVLNPGNSPGYRGGFHAKLILNIDEASLTGANPDQFAIASDSCSNATVAVGDTCTVGVQFNPTTRGAQTAELDLPSNDANSPVDIALSGTGLTPAALSVDQTSNDFGSWTIGQNSYSATFTVTNTGDRPLPSGR